MTLGGLIFSLIATTIIVLHSIPLAAALKKRNPMIKTMQYMPINRAGDSPLFLDPLKAHPQWWLRDDFGNVINWRGDLTRPMSNFSVPACQDWYAHLSIDQFQNHSVAMELLDGVLLDGDAWQSYPNVSQSRLDDVYKGLLSTTRKMRDLLATFNGAEVIVNNFPWGRGDVGTIRDPWPMMEQSSGLFDEMFGSFSTMDVATGQWDVEKMQLSFDSILNMTRHNKTVQIHAFPGPAGTSVGSEGMFPIRGNTTPGSTDTFHVAQWAGAQRVPKSADECRAAAASRLVESLAPFLIVASERTFFSYAWYYNVEDGYLPCPKDRGVECGMPNEWYPEYRYPPGRPLGAATTDADRVVWTRSFEHAEVFVDLRNRPLSRIDWESKA
jgi:hypothetical protein